MITSSDNSEQSEIEDTSNKTSDQTDTSLEYQKTIPENLIGFTDDMIINQADSTPPEVWVKKIN